MNWAMVKNGIVENVIVADQAFIDYVQADWDECIPFDAIAEEAAKPGPGWTYDGATFSPPIA